jgi:hypothetical protein
VPRLLIDYHTAIFAPASASRSSDASSRTGALGNKGQKDLSQEIKRLTTLSILDFPSERIASSLVDLWSDLADAKSRQDFLRYHEGWVAHSVLLACASASGAEVIERVIEVACCLDLLCQHHVIALATIQSIKQEAISRLTIWTKVQSPLAHKMEEVISGCLAEDVHPATVFRAPRDASLEYWILSRPYVTDEELLIESLKIEPERGHTGDVETRITQLESLLVKMNDFTDTSLSVDDNNSELDVEGSTSGDASAISWSDEDAIVDHNYRVEDLARQTRNRISQRLETLKAMIHSKAKDNRQDGSDRRSLSVLPQELASSSIDGFDQRTIITIGGQTASISTQRKVHPNPEGCYKSGRKNFKNTRMSTLGDRQGSWI